MVAKIIATNLLFIHKPTDYNFYRSLLHCSQPPVPISVNILQLREIVSTYSSLVLNQE